jgi:hypothetical protein
VHTANKHVSGALCGTNPVDLGHAIVSRITEITGTQHGYKSCINDGVVLESICTQVKKDRKFVQNAPVNSPFLSTKQNHTELTGRTNNKDVLTWLRLSLGSAGSGE